jgi:hypothetical protein
MNREFIPYEQALALKELDFDEKCLAFYDGKGDSNIYFNNKRDASGDYIPFIKHERLTWFGAPLYQQAFRWFREKYRDDFYTNKWIDDKYWYHVPAVFNDRGFDEVREYREPFDTYEEAELACLIKLIELVKNK